MDIIKNISGRFFLKEHGRLSYRNAEYLAMLNKSGLYSRRIDETNRFVYEIYDNQVIVKS